nr:putative zinc finger, CCHC-type, retrotransposon Gag domain protein [Tanacetum cinerariifolium]
MVNVIPPNHVDDVHVVEPDQHDDVYVVPKLVLVNEDEDLEEDKFEEEEDPQEEEDDMEVDIKEDENEPELTYPYKEMDPLNPSPPASESEPKDAIEVENPIEHEDETVPASVHEKGKANDKFYGKLTLALGNEVRSSMEQGTVVMEKQVEKHEDDMEVDIKEDENEPELTYPYKEMDPLNPSPPASESEPEDAIEVENPIEHEDETVLASVHEVGESSIAPFLREDSDGLLPGLIRRDINSFFGQMASLSRRLCGREMAYALVKKKGKANDKFYGKLTLALGNEVRSSMEQGTVVMEKQVEKHAKQVNVRNEASGSGLVRGQDAAHAAGECTFTRFMKYNPTTFHGTKGAIELMRLFEKTESVFRISECTEGKKVRLVVATLQGPALTWWNAKVTTRDLETVNRMPYIEMKQLMTAEFCSIEEIQIMEHELWNLKVKKYNIMSYTQRLTDNFKGKVISSKSANLSEAVRMAHKLICQKAQARDERILEGKKRKWESFQSRNSSRKGNQRDNSRQTLQNNQKKGNMRAMVTAPTDGKLPLCERCFTRHVVNHVFEIDLMPIKLGMFSIIIGMDWLVNHDSVIVCGKKLVCIPSGNKMLIVESDKGGSRLKVISCIKARKYIERGCHLFLAHVTENKSKEKRMEDVLVIRDFPEVFSKELP